MARKDSSGAVGVQGLGALNRSLGKIDKDLKRQSVGHLRGIARKVSGTASGIAPVKTGKLARSLRPIANTKGASVVSTLPYSAVQNYGGTIRPKGAPIHIERHDFVGKAIHKDADDIAEQLGDLLDTIARANGFH